MTLDEVCVSAIASTLKGLHGKTEDTESVFDDCHAALNRYVTDRVWKEPQATILALRNLKQLCDARVSGSESVYRCEFPKLQAFMAGYSQKPTWSCGQFPSYARGAMLRDRLTSDEVASYAKAVWDVLGYIAHDLQRRPSTLILSVFVDLVRKLRGS